MSGHVISMLEDASRALACADTLNPSALQDDIVAAARRHILRAAKELAPGLEAVHTEETPPSPIPVWREEGETYTVITSSSSSGRGSAYTLFISALTPTLRSVFPGLPQRQVLTRAAALWQKYKNPKATLESVVTAARAELAATSASTFRSVDLDTLGMPPLEEAS
jgi:hypothetical protein